MTVSRSAHVSSNGPVCFLFMAKLKKGKKKASVVAQLVKQFGDLGPISGLGRYPGEGNSYGLQDWAGEFHGLYSPWGHRESAQVSDRHTHAKKKSLVVNNYSDI